MSEEIKRKAIFPPDGPLVHYSSKNEFYHGIEANGTLYLPGMSGLLPNKIDKLIEGGVAAETRQALCNLKDILVKAKSDFHKVVKTTVLLTNMDDLKTVNEIYAEFFGPHLPARSVYQVSKLHLGAHVQIDAIAITGDVETIDCLPK